ncbi:MAG TPA: glycosyltransferase family 4 protein [Ignavibacteria bacterium]
MSLQKRFDLLVVSQLFYPELVSTGQTLTELIEELSSSGLKIKVITSQPTIVNNSSKVPSKITYKGIEIVRTWSTRFTKLFFWGKLVNQLTFFISSSLTVIFGNPKSHLVLLTNPPYLPLLGWLNHFIYRASYGVILFDIMPEQAELLNVIKRGGLLGKLWKYINSLWYRKASYVVVLSKDMLEGAISNANLSGHKHEKTFRDKTQIIHIWSDDRIIKPYPKSESIEAQRLNVIDKFVIQYSGNLARFHDIETILEIARKLSNNDKIIFQFIGEGQKKRTVLEYQNNLRLSNIYVSSYVNKDILPYSLAMADLGVVAQLPGQERVCYPSKLLGVMAAGKAIFAICPKNCEMAEMIISNNIGFVIENGDSDKGVGTILKAMDDPLLVSKMGMNAFQYLQKHFTLVNAAGKYYNIINKFVKKT